MVAPAGAPAHMWFIKTGGEVWGPYPEARVVAFVGEGRVRPTTLLSPFARGPWAPAADTPEFTGPFRASGKGGHAPAAPSAGPDTPAVQPPERADANPASVMPPTVLGTARPVLVFAELVSVAPAAFQAGLARIGPCLQVRPGLWLVRSTAGAAALRNLLSARLTGGDSLLIIEAPLDQAAWFNLAPAQDRDLRRLWSGN